MWLLHHVIDLGLRILVAHVVVYIAGVKANSKLSYVHATATVWGATKFTPHSVIAIIMCRWEVVIPGGLQSVDQPAIQSMNHLSC